MDKGLKLNRFATMQQLLKKQPETLTQEDYSDCQSESLDRANFFTPEEQPSR